MLCGVTLRAGYGGGATLHPHGGDIKGRWETWKSERQVIVRYGWCHPHTGNTDTMGLI